MSFPRSGSSLNPSLARVMGGRGEGFIEIKFPLTLVSGWYTELKHTKFRVFEHRKEKTGIFQHEFIVLRLLDTPSVCRIERMGDPDARFDALSRQGSVAQDIIQCFGSEDEARLKSSKLISRVELPCDFDIMDVLKICRAMHEGEKTRNYTLRVYNCYFFTLAIQVCLTRLIAHWEGEELFNAWSSEVNGVVENLTHSETDETLVASKFPSHQPILFRIYSILNPHGHQTTPLMADIKSRLKSHIAASSTVHRRDMTYRVNDLLWHSDVDRSLKEFMKEKVRENLRMFWAERLKAQTTSSGLIAPAQALKVEILSNLTSLLDLGAMLAPNEMRIELDTPGSKALRQKLVEPPVDGHSPIKNIAEMTYNPPAAQPLAATNTRATWYRSSLQFEMPLVLYSLRRFQLFVLWVLHDVQNAWGIMLFAFELDKLPCTIIEQKLDPIVAKLEKLDELTELHLQPFAEELRGLVGNQFATWNERPWDGICNSIKQGISASLLEDLEDSKPKIRICYLENSEPITENVSVFQTHVSGRVEIHAKKVGWFWPGSVDKIQAELRETLPVVQPGVWKEIRDDGSLVEKPAGNHQDMSFWHASLGVSYNDRFRHLGELADLEKAIECDSRALASTPDGHPDMSDRHASLGVSYGDRFQRLGELADLEKAIECFSHALASTPDGHPKMSDCHASLGVSYGHRFQRLGELTDLEKAIECFSHALTSTPDGHPNMSDRHASLGVSYGDRFQRLGELADLEKAIECDSRALALTPEGHPDMSDRHAIVK
ncbi:hypothetical protein RSAG8_03712, partial [Rhizoctonia solani AG-8 WAC10335]